MDVPIEQQVEYGQVLEHLHRQCVDTDRKLAPMAVILKDEAGLRRLVSIVSRLLNLSLYCTLSFPDFYR
jgi:hypothetical protein